MTFPRFAGRSWLSRREELVERSTRLAQALPALACCVIAADIVAHTLVASLIQGELPAARYTIEAPEPADKNPASLSNELWIWRIVADGRLLDAGNLERTGRWELLADPTYPVIVHRTQPDGATLAFDARTAMVVALRSNSSGRIILRRGSEVVDHADLYAPQAAPFPYAPQQSASFAPRVVGAEGRTPPAATVALAILFIAAAGLARPWIAPARERLWLAGYLTMTHLAVWATQWVGTNEDSWGYGVMWQGNLAGDPQFFAPGYSMFLAFADVVPGLGKGAAATLIQHVMTVGTLMWLHGVIWRFAPRLIASGWLVLTSVLTPTLFLPQMIQSENLALFAMAGALYFAVLANESGARRHSLVSGGSLGIAILARVVPVVLAVPLFMIQLANPLRSRGLRQGAALLAAASAVVAVPASWFALHGNGFGLTTGVGHHLYNRAVVEQKLLNAAGAETARLRGLLPAVELSQTYPWDLVTLLTDRGLSREDIDRLIWGAAWEATHTAPTAFFWYSFRIAWRDFTANPCELINWFARSGAPDPELENSPALAPTAAGIGLRLRFDWLFARIWPAVCWLAVAGVLLCFAGSNRPVTVALAAVPVGYLLMCGFVQYFLSRYNVAVTPFVTATAMIPLGAIATWHGAKARTATAIHLSGHTHEQT